MPHIHTNDGQHDHTASAFILKLDRDGTPRAQLHMHRKLHVYMQIGGHIELNETPWQSISHEMPEESGYDVSQMKIVQPKQHLVKLSKSVVHPVPFSQNTHIITEDPKHFHTDLSYLFVTNEEPNSNPDSGESDDFIYVNREEMAELSRDKLFANVRELYDFAFDIYDSLDASWVLVDTKTFS